MKYLLFLVVLPAILAMVAATDGARQTDVIPTSAGDLTITFIGHGTLMFSFNGHIIHVDPYSRLADYATLPKADLVLITHHHGDHLDPVAIEKIRTPHTEVILPALSAEQLGSGTVMANGDRLERLGITIEAVPAYNRVHRRDNGQPYHVKGEGNGYVLTFGDKRVYVAGDTENIPEMSHLGKIDVAFLPMNLPYTMTPEMVAEAAVRIKPAILYPYHMGRTDPNLLVELLKGHPEIDVRIRRLE